MGASRRHDGKVSNRVYFDMQQIQMHARREWVKEQLEMELVRTTFRIYNHSARVILVEERLAQEYQWSTLSNAYGTKLPFSVSSRSQ